MNSNFLIVVIVILLAILIFAGIISLAKSPQQVEQEKHQQLKEQKIKMLNATGFGNEIFEGVTPLSAGGAPGGPAPRAGRSAGLRPGPARPPG